jgi:CO/xanthine dehydrogenase FAD-binding subunit
VAIQKASAGKTVKLICGNTSTGVYDFDTYDVYVDISAVAELKGIDVGRDSITFGATTTLTEVPPPAPAVASPARPADAAGRRALAPG